MLLAYHADDGCYPMLELCSNSIKCRPTCYCILGPREHFKHCKSYRYNEETQTEAKTTCPIRVMKRHNNILEIHATISFVLFIEQSCGQ